MPRCMYSRDAQILQRYITDTAVLFVDTHRFMFLAPVLHARAQKTDFLTKVLSASLQ